MGHPWWTVDQQKLNAATMKETHHTPSQFNHVSIVSARTNKTVLEPWNRYYCLPLTPMAWDATKFITEWGCYRYLWATQGFHASGDGKTRRIDDITVDTFRKIRCIDDTLVWDETTEFTFLHTLYYITHCTRNGTAFNPDKFQFAGDKVCW